MPVRWPGTEFRTKDRPDRAHSWPPNTPWLKKTGTPSPWSTYPTLPQRVSIVAAATAETRWRCIGPVRASHGGTSSKAAASSKPRKTAAKRAAGRHRRLRSKLNVRAPAMTMVLVQSRSVSNSTTVAVPPTGKLAILCRLPAAWDQPRGGLRQRGWDRPSASDGTTTGPPAPPPLTLHSPRPVSGSGGPAVALVVHTLESVEEVEERMRRWPSAPCRRRSQSCRAGLVRR